MRIGNTRERERDLDGMKSHIRMHAAATAAGDQRDEWNEIER
jgi:phage terminase Nu1 subunit (DNA packaging protein)